ncbi:MAG: hypothetical protein QM669_01970 [Siphonobacter sp.]
MNIRVVLLGVAGVLANALAFSQIPFDKEHWTIVGKMEKETYLGRDCIRLSEGALYSKDSTFLNGSIEFDMVLSRNRYFPGFGFRVQNSEQYEHIYLRPHQLGNPDAIQYMPVYNGQEAWQLYYGEGYSTALTYPLEEWVHIRLLVKDTQAEVYVGSENKSRLIIHQLKRVTKPGRISLINGGPIVARYANVHYTKTDRPTFVGTFKPEPAPNPGVIPNWLISSTFDEKVLGDSEGLPKSLMSNLTWQKCPTEVSGVINLSKISKLQARHTTVLAKITLTSDRAQIKKLQFGFSDKVRVYVNYQPVYEGHDRFASRDYRFLGTIGYFDAVFLDLKKGKNEIVLAITEEFGGWGVQAIMAEQSGITIEP